MNLPPDLHCITKAEWRTETSFGIAQRLGITERRVRYYRQVNDLPKGPRKTGSGRPAVADRSEFLLDETNNQNAERLGITPQRAGQIRRELLNDGRDWV